MLKKILLACLLFLSSFNVFVNYSFAKDNGNSFKPQDATKFLEDKFNDSINKAWELGISEPWSRWTRDFIANIATKVVAPIVFLIGILLAFIGFYKLFFSDKEDERKKWLNFVIYGVLWVILAVAWPFIAKTLVWDSWTSGILWWNNIQWGNVAENLYSQIIIKFFSLFIYLVILVVFIILVINVIKLIATPDKEDTAKHAKTIVVWNSIWLIIMLAAKNIVETFYKKSWYWMNTWGPILENTHLWWLYTILNYTLAFVAFAITVLIIYQAFLLLTKPDDDATYKNLKKYFVYAIIWVLLIGWIYLIANFFIIR
jgi:multisubunit Na+/H+ antiporter MnhB subunit